MSSTTLLDFTPPAPPVVVALAWGSPLLVTPGRLDSVARYAYTHGQCGALAIALHRAIKAPLCLVVDSDSDVDEFLARSRHHLLPDVLLGDTWLHAVVTIDPDRYLDINGVHSAQDLADIYDTEVLVVPTTARQIRRLHFTAEDPPLLFDLASTFVDPVLTSSLRAGGAPRT